MNWKELARLVLRVIRTGRFRHSGFDFAKRRREVLTDLQVADNLPAAKYAWVKRPCLRTWLSQAAYIKGSLKVEGSHLAFPARGISYIRIPKAASTSLTKAILRARFPQWRTQTLTAEQINFLADHHLQKKYHGEQSTTFFTVVRNPFSRIVSVYREAFEMAQDSFLYEDYLFGILRKDFSFEQFVKVVRMIPDQLKDQHFKPQYQFLKYYEQRRLPVTILKLEERDRVERFLGEFGLPFEVIHQSVTAYDYRTYYDNESLNIVASIYDQDILRFHYGAVYPEIKSIIEQRPVHI